MVLRHEEYVHGLVLFPVGKTEEVHDSSCFYVHDELHLTKLEEKRYECGSLWKLAESSEKGLVNFVEFM